MIRYEVDVKANDDCNSHLVHGERFDTLQQAKKFCRDWVVKEGVYDCSIYKIDTAITPDDEYAGENQVWVIDCSLKDGKITFSKAFYL